MSRHLYRLNNIDNNIVLPRWPMLVIVVDFELKCSNACRKDWGKRNMPPMATSQISHQLPLERLKGPDSKILSPSTQVVLQDAQRSQYLCDKQLSLCLLSLLRTHRRLEVWKTVGCEGHFCWQDTISTTATVTQS